MRAIRNAVVELESEEKKMSPKIILRFVIAVIIALGALASVVAQMPDPYGMPISTGADAVK